MKRRKTPGLAALLGQLLVIGFDGLELTPQLAGVMARVQPGGVILFARNIVNAAQTQRLLRECRAQVEEPLLTMVDLEGGRVDRFRAVFGPAPSAAEVFATDDRRLFRKHGEIIGRMCSGLGFNVDLAPVLDLAFHASQKIMSTRSVSADPGQVSLYAREFLRGLKARGVIGAGKHFPGLGEGDLDSHHQLPVIKKGFEKLWQQDLAPYRTLKRELPMVLVNHASYPAITRDRRPASLSRKWISEVLRRRMGYRGLVLSDDLEMGGVLRSASIEEAAVEFIRAGGDLCLICRREEYVERAFAALSAAAERDSAFRRRVLQSARRVADFKRKSREIRRRVAPLSSQQVTRLSTRLWEFSECVRLQSIARGGSEAGA